MTKSDFIANFDVEQTPQEVFAAIGNVPGWWSGAVEGVPDRVGAEFTYRVPGVHFCRMRVTDFVPGERMVWRVVESDIEYVGRKTEWNDTEIRFEMAAEGGMTELRFTHQGLVPALECFDACSNAWNALVTKNLQNLIRTGEVQPSPWA